MSCAKKERIRSTTFTQEEELSLVCIISKYKTIIECKTSNLYTPQQKEQAWTNIVEEFNSVNRSRSAQQIKSKYDNLKTATRKYASLQRENFSGTGGGPCNKVVNVVYDKMLDLLNKKTVFGMSNSYDDDADPLPVTIVEKDTYEVAGCGKDAETIIFTDVSTSTLGNVIIEVETPSNTLSTNIKENTQTWSRYTPKMIKKRKSLKLDVENKPTPKVKEARTLYNLKSSYIEQKIINLRNEDQRKKELHLKQMQLLEIQIANSNATQNN